MIQTFLPRYVLQISYPSMSLRKVSCTCLLWHECAETLNGWVSYFGKRMKQNQLVFPMNQTRNKHDRRLLIFVDFFISIAYEVSLCMWRSCLLSTAKIEGTCFFAVYLCYRDFVFGSNIYSLSRNTFWLALLVFQCRGVTYLQDMAVCSSIIANSGPHFSNE